MKNLLIVLLSILFYVSLKGQGLSLFPNPHRLQKANPNIKGSANVTLSIGAFDINPNLYFTIKSKNVFSIGYFNGFFGESGYHVSYSRLFKNIEYGLEYTTRKIGFYKYYTAHGPKPNSWTEGNAYFISPFLKYEFRNFIGVSLKSDFCIENYNYKKSFVYFLEPSLYLKTRKEFSVLLFINYFLTPFEKIKPLHESAGGALGISFIYDFWKKK